MSDWDQNYKNRLQRREEIQAWHAEQQLIHDGLSDLPLIVEVYHPEPQFTEPEAPIEELKVEVEAETQPEPTADEEEPLVEEEPPAEEEAKPVKKAAAKKAAATPTEA